MPFSYPKPSRVTPEAVQSQNRMVTASKSSTFNRLPMRQPEARLPPDQRRNGHTLRMRPGGSAIRCRRCAHGWMRTPYADAPFSAPAVWPPETPHRALHTYLPEPFHCRVRRVRLSQSVMLPCLAPRHAPPPGRSSDDAGVCERHRRPCTPAIALPVSKHFRLPTDRFVSRT